MNEFAIGFIASLLAAIVTWSIPRFRVYYRRRRFEGVLPIAKNRVAVIVGSKTGFKPEYSKDLWVHSEAIYGITRLTRFFNGLHANIALRIDSELGVDDRFDLEICIGGPNGNSRTRWFITEYAQNLLDSKGLTVHKGEGLIIKISIPLTEEGTNKVTILLYGDTVHDTYSAVAYFCNHADELIQKRLQNPNAVIRLRTKQESSVQHATFLRDESFLLEHN